MKKWNYPLLLKVVIIALALAGLGLCAIYYPYQTGLLHFKESAALSGDDLTSAIVRLSFDELFSLPCFFLCFLGFKVIQEWEQAPLLSLQASRWINQAGIILLIDSFLSLIEHAIFFGLLRDVNEGFYAFLSFVGLLLGVFFLAFGHYVALAAAKTVKEAE
jgi:hypothetical protein